MYHQQPELKANNQAVKEGKGVLRLEVENACRIHAHIYCEPANRNLNYYDVAHLLGITDPISCIVNNLREPNAPR